ERSFQENLTLARTLPAVAGMVNVIGYVNLGFYTSHVTGRVSGFGVNVAKEKFTEAGFMLGLVVSFIIGAMLASAFIELAKVRHWPRYQLPLLIEALLLSIITLFEVSSSVPLTELAPFQKFLFAVALSVSMGLQNALVARLSGAVVRTTHVTGVSTDLGIESVRVIRWYLEHTKDKTLLEQMRDFSAVKKDAQLYRVRLYLTILGSFLFGATAGGLLNASIGVIGMAVPILVLVALVIYDRILGVSEEDLAENFNPKFDEKAVVQNAAADAKA
ncbi:MAG: YoaK family protein, partial [Myxococcaceae bacterium]|nr:YoaK family protein [Myxococcaceae bacterium]